MSLMDGTVFEIVKELEEIQQLNEKSLHSKRLKVDLIMIIVFLCWEYCMYSDPCHSVV